MKLLMSCLLLVCSLQANASLSDVLDSLGNVNRQGGGHFSPSRPGHGPGRPGPGYGPGRPGPGRPPGGGYNPGYPPAPAYPQPGYPGGGAVTCTAGDRGWEEHGGGHFSCRECLASHGECTETCSATEVLCQAQGVDRYNQLVNFNGRGGDQWSAQNDAVRNCSYSAGGCRVTNCNTNRNVVSSRSCR